MSFEAKKGGQNTVRLAILHRASIATSHLPYLDIPAEIATATFFCVRRNHKRLPVQPSILFSDFRAIRTVRSGGPSSRLVLPHRIQLHAASRRGHTEVHGEHKCNVQLRSKQLCPEAPFRRAVWCAYPPFVLPFLHCTQSPEFLPMASPTNDLYQPNRATLFPKGSCTTALHYCHYCLNDHLVMTHLLVCCMQPGASRTAWAAHAWCRRSISHAARTALHAWLECRLRPASRRPTRWFHPTCSSPSCSSAPL